MQMMGPQFAQAPQVPLQPDPPASSTSEDLSSAAQKKKSSRWTETEEKILTELFANFMKAGKDMRQKAVEQSRAMKTDLNTINRRINQLKTKVCV